MQMASLVLGAFVRCSAVACHSVCRRCQSYRHWMRFKAPSYMPLNSY